MSAATTDLVFAQIVYGSRIDTMQAVDCNGKDVVIPTQGLVTILCFFNIDSPPHVNVLNSLNFLLVNLKQPEKIRLYAISKGKMEMFKNIKSKYNLYFDLINDQKAQLLKFFNSDCGSCMKFVVLDKKRSIRYLSSNFDEPFLRAVIQRYINED